MDTNSGSWQFQRTLGVGGFGAVLLYINQETGQQLAIKQCRQSSDLAERTRSRWTQECEIMLRLKHPNVVQGFQLPTELNHLLSGDLPVLAMEFCDQGDLRKVLNRPENCCGLPEYQVRQVAHDTAAAVEYLHSKHVMHRDLKPENIVIGDAGNGRISFKLIDLGYAKDLTNDSICTSFVGTLQYLAPELFAGQGSKYTSTVDYWSLGTTIFECITGIRPFLHNLPPVRWLNVVSVKRLEHIHAFLNESNKVEYSDKLPTPNHLSSLSQSYFEQWLRMMLDFEPRTRGAKSGLSALADNKQRPYCFEHLDKILNTKLIHVFNVLNGETYASPVATTETASRTVADISKALQITWRIEPSDQLLLTESGIMVDPRDSLASCACHQEIPPSKDVIDLFMFSRSSATSLVELRKAKPLPRQLQLMLENQHVDHVFADQIEVCKHVIQHCALTCRDIDRLIQSRSVASLSLIQQRSELSTDVMKIISELGDVITRIAFFSQCTDTDLSELQVQQQSNGIFSQKMRDSWVARRAEVNQYSTMSDEVYKFRDQSDELHVRVQQLQHVLLKSELSENQLHTALQLQQSKKIFEKLKSLPQDQRHTAATTPDIVYCIEECWRASLRIIADIDTHIREIMKCLLNIHNLREKIKVTLVRIHSAQSRIMDYQRQRQENVWWLLRQVASKIPKDKKETNTETASPPFLDLRPSPFAMNVPTGGEDESSLALHNISIGCQHKLQELVHSIADESKQFEKTLADCDWSFLDVKIV